MRSLDLACGTLPHSLDTTSGLTQTGLLHSAAAVSLHFGIYGIRLPVTSNLGLCSSPTTRFAQLNRASSLESKLLHLPAGFPCSRSSVSIPNRVTGWVFSLYLMLSYQSWWYRPPVLGLRLSALNRRFLTCPLRFRFTRSSPSRESSAGFSILGSYLSLTNPDSSNESALPHLRGVLSKNVN
jgi:hypothetical protein